MDIFNFAIFICMYMVLPILYFVLRNESKPKKNIVLGVTLPYTARDSREVQAISGRFRKNLLIMLVVLTVLGAGGVFIPYQSVMLTYEMVWFLFAIAVPFFIYASSNTSLKKLRADFGWAGEKPASAAAHTELGTRGFLESLTAESGVPGNTDGDRHWLWGIIYYNKDDEKTIISSRVGMGTTVNMAKPAGKALAVIAALCLAALPFLGIWMMAEEFTPVRIEFADNTVYAYHTGQEYAISVGSIDEYERIQELPRLSKIVGTGMKSVLKGKFNVEGYGTCQLCLDPRTGDYMVLSAGGVTYILNGNEEIEGLISKDI